MPLDPTKAYIDGDFFDVEVAISQLLNECLLFANFRNYSHDDKNFTKDGCTIILFLNCSDVFAWGCADAEDVSGEEELKQLYDYCVKYPTWGSTIWVALKRKEKPQYPVVKRMKELNEWDISLDKLTDNRYDAYIKKEYGNKETD